MATDFDFTRAEMAEPIERMFEREFPNKYSLFEEIDENTEGGSGYVHLAYIQGSRKGLHVVRLEESYKNCLTNVNAGVHSLAKVEANYLWLALPLHEFRDGEDGLNNMLADMCTQRGIGIIGVQQKGLGMSAKVLLAPEKNEGNFLPMYGSLRERWRHANKGLTSEGEYRVVGRSL